MASQICWAGSSTFVLTVNAASQACWRRETGRVYGNAKQI
jgi:hypothetical protein